MGSPSSFTTPQSSVADCRPSADVDLRAAEHEAPERVLVRRRSSRAARGRNRRAGRRRGSLLDHADRERGGGSAAVSPYQSGGSRSTSRHRPRSSTKAWRWRQSGSAAGSGTANRMDARAHLADQVLVEVAHDARAARASTRSGYRSCPRRRRRARRSRPSQCVAAICEHQRAASGISRSRADAVGARACGRAAPLTSRQSGLRFSRNAAVPLCVLGAAHHRRQQLRGLRTPRAATCPAARGPHSRAGSQWATCRRSGRQPIDLGVEPWGGTCGSTPPRVPLVCISARRCRSSGVRREACAAGGGSPSEKADARLGHAERRVRARDGQVGRTRPSRPRLLLRARSSAARGARTHEGSSTTALRGRAGSTWNGPSPPDLKTPESRRGRPRAREPIARTASFAWASTRPHAISAPRRRERVALVGRSIVIQSAAPRTSRRTGSSSAIL